MEKFFVLNWRWVFNNIHTLIKCCKKFIIMYFMTMYDYVSKTFPLHQFTPNKEWNNLVGLMIMIQLETYLNN